MSQINWQPNLRLGAGYDEVRGEAKQVGVTGVASSPSDAAGQQGDFNALIVQSSEEFDDATNISAEASGGYGLFSASAKMDFKRRSKVSSQATFCVLRVFAQNAYQQLTEPVLTDDAMELLRNQNAQRFRERFGDKWVSGQFSGVEFYGSVRIEASKRETQQEIAAQVQAHYAGAGGSVSLDNKVSMSSSEQRIEITTFQKGGSVNICSSFADLSRLAQQALDEGRAGRGYPFSVEVDSYDELKLPMDGASFVDAQIARRLMERYARLLRDFLQDQQDIDFVVRNKAWFEDFSEAELREKGRLIAAEINTIRDRADICSRDFKQCQDYSPAAIDLRLPARKAGAPAIAPEPAQPPIVAQTPSAISGDMAALGRGSRAAAWSRGRR